MAGVLSEGLDPIFWESGKANSSREHRDKAWILTVSD